MRATYQGINDLPAEIPVFPLVSAILLPRATMPLNIFEPRYLAMVDAALGADRLIGMIQPTSEGGVTGSPEGGAALCRVGCAGRITAFQELDDGHQLIVLKGVARFVIGSQQTSTTPYRVFRVDYRPFAADLAAATDEADVDREKLLDVLKRFLDGRQATADWKQISATGTEQLVNWLSVASPFAPKEKQALLEAPSLKQRAETLIALAEMELASSGTAGGGSTGRVQ